MKVEGTRPEPEDTETNVPATEQEVRGQFDGVVATCKKIVPSLSAIAITFLSSDLASLIDSMGGGNHGGRGH